MFEYFYKAKDDMVNAYLKLRCDTVAMFDNTGNDYTSVDYWDSRFKDEDSYEWIADFKQFSELLVKEIKTNDRSDLLKVGTKV